MISRFIAPLSRAYRERMQHMHAVAVGADAMDTDEASSANADQEVLPAEAIEWAVAQAMADPSPDARGGGSRSRLPQLFSILQQMATAWDDDDEARPTMHGGLAAAWSAFPCIRSRWHAMLRERVLEPNALEFVLARVPELLTTHNIEREAKHLRRSITVVEEGKPLPPPYVPWWSPLTETESVDKGGGGGAVAGAEAQRRSSYQLAVKTCLDDISSVGLLWTDAPTKLRVLRLRLVAIEGPENAPLPTRSRHVRSNKGRSARARYMQREARREPRSGTGNGSMGPKK